ncbi:MAG: anhydro-N-acetylmuramic acid kinase [Pseudomonadota bacterium]
MTADGLYIGLISGTSMDGIDAALVELGDHTCKTLATRGHDYPKSLQDRLLAASRQPESIGVDELGRLDHAVGECFRDAALGVIELAGADRAAIAAIGSHGQTVRHLPRDEEAFSLQIGDPNVIAAGTGITTVADFRRRDIALGGEGAPIAPGFHQWLFGEASTTRVVLNIGGFANVTVLPGAGGKVTGFDTGPGNSLLDAWHRLHVGGPFDAGGAWAASGSIDERLLADCLDDPYFPALPPKSTGFEYFNLDWLERRLGGRDIAPADVQATLLGLTVTSIADVIQRHAVGAAEVLVCGGGVHNEALMVALTDALRPAVVRSTDTSGLHPDWVEAAAFAWLASRTLRSLPGNLPDVTGARSSAVLGCIYPGIP